ncbi:MAG: patatin family protein [Bacteroidaceae bacterium]|nr:patatin family protein [Bacteroidaceae bacterium]
MGLVLEGGGMRGVFTCGVLDYFLDAGLHFPYVVGVSAGACNGLSFMSRQRGRARTSNIEMLRDYKYIGLRFLPRQHSILDLNFLFGEMPSTILPYDYDAYRANPTCFEMVTTDCLTGKACYLHEPSDPVRLLRICQASSSLPYVCPVIYVDNIPMLDGGIVDSIPVLHAIEKGYEKNVVVLTRNKGYRKSEKDIRVPRFIYNRFPHLREALSHRCAVYNEQLQLVEQMEEEGKVIAIRPKKRLEVGRMERNINRLIALYEEGYECGREAFENEFLKKDSNETPDGLAS